MARADRDLGGTLQIALTYFREAGGPHRGPSARDTEWLLQAVREWLAHDPGLATRNCYIDKRWDQIHYLLSARRRGGPPEPDDVVLDAAIEGEATIESHVVASQGFPLRHTSPAMVARIDGLLARLDVKSLRRHYDLSAMEAQGVYKAFAGPESPEDWQYLTTLIGELQTFYAAAALAGNSVLVVTD
jgi:hypothetical protein